MLPLKFCTVVCFQFMVARWLPVFQSGPKRVIIYRWEQAKNKSICTYTTDKKTQNWSCKQKQAHQAVGWTTWTTTLFYAWHFWAKEIFQHMTHLHSIYIRFFSGIFFKGLGILLLYIFHMHGWKTCPQESTGLTNRELCKCCFVKTLWLHGLYGNLACEKNMFGRSCFWICAVALWTRWLTKKPRVCQPNGSLYLAVIKNEWLQSKSWRTKDLWKSYIYIYLILFHLYFP